MRRILLTTDGSENSLKSAAYVASLYGGVTDVEVTLLTIYPAIPPLYREESLNPSVRRQFSEWLKKREEESSRFLTETAKGLQRGGFKSGQIKTKQAQQVVGVARDIIREMDAQKYDTSVIGKKGMSWFDEYLLGSITSKILEISEGHPLWVVEGKGFSSRKVLVAMDETEDAVNLARYAGRMLQGLAGVEFLFYHYCSPFTETLTKEEREKMKGAEKKFVQREQEEMVHSFGEAQKILLNAGFEKKSVSSRFDYDSSAPPQKVSQAVLKEMRSGDFGTLIMGRKGSTNAREFRVGSVAMRIVSQAQSCAVWVV